jgi:hypothetical protein
MQQWAGQSFLTNRQFFTSCFGSAAKAKIAQRYKRPGEPMHKVCTIVIAIIMTAPSIAGADPLAAGKPAGVRAAQMTGKEWIVLGGVSALGIGIAIATAGGRSSAANSSQPISVVTTSGTSV